MVRVNAPIPEVLYLSATIATWRAEQAGVLVPWAFATLGGSLSALNDGI